MRATVIHCGWPFLFFHMNLALRMRSTVPGGIIGWLSGLVRSHSMSQAVSLLVRSFGSALAAGKHWRTMWLGGFGASAGWAVSSVAGAAGCAATDVFLALPAASKVRPSATRNPTRHELARRP